MEISFDELIPILQSLHTLSGFRICVYDADFKESCARPLKKSSFCAMVQESPEGLARCQACDRQAFDRVKQTNETYVYQCHCGLCEAVTPLYYHEHVSGYLMMGQVMNPKENDRVGVFRSSVRYARDPAALKSAIEELPLCTAEQVLACISIMNVCASYITLNKWMRLTPSGLAEQLMEYLREHYASAITIDGLCGHFSRSRATVTRAFKNRYGCSIHQALIGIRLDRAEQLMASSDRALDDIAYACGFYDQNHFAKAFKARHGMTPSGWRGARRGTP